MNITNDEKTLITKEERTWPPEHCEVYLVDENNHGIIFVREEKTITIKNTIKNKKYQLIISLVNVGFQLMKKEFQGNGILQMLMLAYLKKIFGYTENIGMKIIQQKNSWLFMMNV